MSDKRSQILPDSTPVFTAPTPRQANRVDGEGVSGDRAMLTSVQSGRDGASTLGPQGTTTEVQAYRPEPPLSATPSSSASSSVSSGISSSSSDLSADLSASQGDRSSVTISPELFVSRARLLMMTLLLLTAYISYDALTTLEPFQIREVVFVGQRRVAAPMLQATLQLDRLRPSWLTPRLAEIEESVLKHEWIKSAEASLDYWSGVISVEVREHKPRGVIMLEELKAVTADGIPFATVSPQEAEDLTLISGLPPEIFQGSPEDKLVGHYWIAQAIKLAAYVKTSKLLDHGRLLSEVHIAPTGRFEIMLNKIRIILGSDLLRERILEVERILDHLDQRGTSAAYILLSDDLNRAIIKEVPRAGGVVATP